MHEISGTLPRPDGHRMAYRKLDGRAPAVLWLGGFASDMAGTKAQALARWAARTGNAFVRFDYFGHGASSGAFRDGTITRWRQDALAALDELTSGPAVVVGSSMGGWIACLLALARPERIGGLVLVAPAADFTEMLIRPRLSAVQQAELMKAGLLTLTSAYEARGLQISKTLIEDGARWSILQGPVGITAPVRTLHGERDEEVPWRHGLELHQAIESNDAVFTLVGDGDHRLSRPQDLRRLISAVEELAELTPQGVGGET
jgi:pimeloyl-ACP methyl ester carboxylesterase